MGRRGPQTWEPTEEDIAKVALYAGLGSNQQQIADMLGWSIDTIMSRPAIKEAYNKGRAQTIAKVAGTLVQKALAGDTASAIFYLKTQGRWKETMGHEHTGKDGEAIKVDHVKSDADAFTRAITGIASRTGAASGTGQAE